MAIEGGHLVSSLGEIAGIYDTDDADDAATQDDDTHGYPQFSNAGLPD
jgi:hypothetical protein